MLEDRESVIHLKAVALRDRSRHVDRQTHEQASAEAAELGDIIRGQMADRRCAWRAASSNRRSFPRE